MNWKNATLDNLPEKIWQVLARACASTRDPLRAPVLGTLGTHKPSLRTVILRQVEPGTRTLTAYTDYRAPKITDLLANPDVEWLFYHPREQLQVRASGTATVHWSDAVCRQAWRKLPLLNRLDYCAAQPPGTAIENPAAALPPALRHTAPTRKNTEAGWPNFAVIVTTVERLDWLWLRPAGHRRAAFHRNGEKFSGAWLVP